MGVPPLYNLAKKLIDKGRKVTVVLGFNTASEVFYEEEFRALSAEVFVTTADGTHGTKGFVTTAIAERSRILIILRLRPAADAACIERCDGRHPGRIEFRGAHGLRLRRLHGLFLSDEKRGQTYL